MATERGERNNGIVAGSPSRTAGKGSSVGAGWSRTAALGTALAVVLLIGCAPAVSRPTVTPSSEQRPRDELEGVVPAFALTEAVPAPVGGRVSASADDVFDTAGTNPRITGAVFSTTEYFSNHGASRGRVWVQVKSAAELNALPSPPPSPFTVPAAVTMTNDEGQTATGTIAFRTTYDRIAADSPTPPRRRAPAFAWTETIATRPGVPFTASAYGTFLHAGTNATLTDADFSTTKYSAINEIHDGRLRFQVKTAAKLNALASPPASPFTVTAAVTMTNDEGQTATGTLTFRTSYARDTTEEVVPTLASAEARTARAGDFVSVGAYDVFDNAGTNARFTGVEFSTMEYYDDEHSGVAPHGKLWVQVKTAAELSALASPPASPFTVTAAVTMTNDEGQTATGTLTFRTTYDRTTTDSPTPPRRRAPTFAWTETIATRPGVPFTASAYGAFLHAGTNATFTDADFSTTEYSDTHEIREGRLRFQVKTAAELNALASPPPSPFTVTAAVTMTNDEGQTATGTLTFRTSYARDTTEEVVPTLASAEARTARAGDFVSVGAYDVFDNAGTNARFTGVEFSTMEYYDDEHSGVAPHGKLWVQVKTAAELNALASPPASPFTVTAAVTMTNDEGQTATGTLTFETTYNRAATS